MNLHFLRWWSLKTKVTVFTLVVFVFGIWSLAFYASRMLREEMRQQLGDQQFSIVSVLAAHVNEELESRLTALQAAAGSVTPAVLADAPALQAHLEERPALLQLFNAGIYVTQRDGTATASSPVSAGRSGINYMDQDHVAAALEEGKSTISRPRIGKTLHAPVFAIAAPIGDARGRVIGAMVGVVDLSRPNFLDKIAQGTYGRTGGYIVVAPQYRTIVTATDKTYIMQAMPEPGVNPLFDRYVQGFEGFGSTVDSRGLSVFSAAKQIPVAGWLLVGRIPAEEALAPIGAMQQRLLLATIAFTLLAGCLIWWATWRLLRSQLTPMLAAGKALETMTGAAGRLQPLPIGSADEIGELIRAFNRLLETLAQREEALNRSRRLLAETGQLGKVGGWAIDIDTGKQTWTEETHSIHEVEPGYEPTVEKGVSFYTDASRPVIERAVQRAVEQAEPFDLELEIVTAKGNLRNIHVIGKADPEHRRVYGFFQDVTGRKRAEVVLRARLRLSDLGHGGSTDDVLRVALDAAEEITGSRIGFFHFVDPDQEHLTLQAWSTNTLAQMCTAEGKGRHYPISEAGVWVECFHARAPVIHNDYASVAHKKGMPAGHATVTRELLVPIIRAGRVTEIIGVGNKASDYLQADVEAVQEIAGTVQDIVERIRSEEARKQLEAQLRESQKMEALGTLAGGVAHDFNNALAAILGNVELARQDVGSGHPALVSLDEIGRTSRRAKDLVQQILTFGRRQKLDRKATSLALAVVESARLIRATLPATASLRVDCRGDAPAVLADATQIKQILLNLCSNALDATRGQGRPGVIEIVLDACGPPQGEAGVDPGPGRCARLTVRDNGCGMDEATRARIFEPFFTTKPMGKGTGLGLSVVHGIVKAHEATIDVESTPGAGSTFRIHFPAVDPSAAAATPRTAAVAPAQGNGKRVLYVDDEEAIIFLMKRLLERQGYRVSGYTDPREALAAVRANPGQFDLAVTDYNMPGMSGLEVARALRDIRADLPVVLASGYITEELRAEAPSAGIREVIYKPNTVDELCEAVARAAQAAGEKPEPS